MSFDKSWEKNKYLIVRQSDKFPYEKSNRYPYDLLVSIVAKKFFNISKNKRKEIKVLDLGCGTGNNAKFLAENGFDVYGIDCSESAIKICKEIFLKINLKGKFAVGDFLNLPYKDNFFDLIIDRESLYANTFDDIKNIINNVHKKLKSKGVFVSFIYNAYHPDRKFGEKIGPNTYDNFKKGAFSEKGIVHFVDLKEINALHSKFKIENIMRHSMSVVYGKPSVSTGFDEYIIISEKK